MIDLTPLDVRKKQGSFQKSFRGYEPGEVDAFLEVLADRMDELVRESATMRERTAQLAEALNAFRGRESAMNEALVMAQQIREEVRAQSQRDADLTIREARAEAERIRLEARRQVEAQVDELRRARQNRDRFLRRYRDFLQDQLAEIEAAEDADDRPSAEGPEVEIDAIPG